MAICNQRRDGRCREQGTRDSTRERRYTRDNNLTVGRGQRNGRNCPRRPQRLPRRSLSELNRLGRISLGGDVSRPNGTRCNGRHLRTYQRSKALHYLRTINTDRRRSRNNNERRRSFSGNERTRSRHLTICRRNEARAIRQAGRRSGGDNGSGSGRERSNVPFVICVLCLRLLSVGVTFNRPLSMLQIIYRLLTRLRKRRNTRGCPSGNDEGHCFRGVGRNSVGSHRRPGRYSNNDQGKAYHGDLLQDGRHGTR